MLLTTDEAAARLNVSPSWLHHDRSLGKERKGPPFVRFGRNVRYREADLLAWIEEKTQ